MHLYICTSIHLHLYAHVYTHIEMSVCPSIHLSIYRLASFDPNPGSLPSHKLLRLGRLDSPRASPSTRRGLIREIPITLFSASITSAVSSPGNAGEVLLS